MIHKCYFPNCEYTTKSRSKIDYHHVLPQELGNSKITVPLCKNHHSLIFHPLATSGQHTIKTDESLEIIGIFESTHGKVVQYKDMKGDTFYYFPFDKTIMRD